VSTWTAQSGLLSDPPLAGRVNHAPIRRTSEPWSTARIDVHASNRTPHRRQERVQPWQPAMEESLHIAGVVSRVPCSSRCASARGTDRNTYLRNDTPTKKKRINNGNWRYEPRRKTEYWNNQSNSREWTSPRHILGHNSRGAGRPRTAAVFDLGHAARGCSAITSAPSRSCSR
jgi:hypothetical protein